MPVTTNDIIKFSDVCVEVYGGPDTSERTLMGAFVDANPEGFNKNFQTENTLLGFRGYEHEPAITDPGPGPGEYEEPPVFFGPGKR
jgi:hypothetical protein